MKFIKSILIALTSLFLITSCDKSSPNGGNPTEEDTGIYLKINEEIDRNNMLHKTKYKDTNIGTYVLGYMSFEYKEYYSYIEPIITYQDFNEHNMLIMTNNIEYDSSYLILKSYKKVNITFKYFPLTNMCYIEAKEMR